MRSGNWLGALELRGGIRSKTHCLQLCNSGNRSVGIWALTSKPVREHRTAIRTAAASDSAHHARRARPELFLRRVMFLWTLFLFCGAFESI